MWISRQVLVLSVVVAVAVGAALDSDLPLESDEIIEAVNNAKTTWKAGRNFDVSLKKGYLKNLVGSLMPNKERILPLLEDDDENLEIPDSFDTRDKWTQCTSIGKIPDQGPCADAWAVFAVGVLTDRMCIATKGNFTAELSVQNLLSCCCPCAVSCGEGCKGGHMDQAWMHLTYAGTVTGAEFKSHEGCQPYQLPPCNHNMYGVSKNCSSYGDVPTPHCQQTCYNKDYKINITNDYHKSSDAFVMMNNTKQMQREMMKGGPLEALFYVYEDFLCYKSGVYQHVTGQFLGVHALKLIGWGKDENGVKYWLAVNSWNENWGDQGLVKILREKDECGVEAQVCGGRPNV